MRIFIEHDEECPEKSLTLETSLKENGVCHKDIHWLYSSDSDKARVFDKFMIPSMSGHENTSLYLSNDWLCIKPIKAMIDYFEQLSPKTYFNFDLSFIYYRNDQLPELYDFVKRENLSAIISLFQIRGESFTFCPYANYDSPISTTCLLEYTFKHPYKFKNHPNRLLWDAYFNKVLSASQASFEQDNHQQ